MRDDDFGAILKVLCVKIRLGGFTSSSSSNLHVRCYRTVHGDCVLIVHCAKHA